MDEKNKLKLSSKIINVYPKPPFLQVLKMPLKEIAKNSFYPIRDIKNTTDKYTDSIIL